MSIVVYMGIVYMAIEVTVMTTAKFFQTLSYSFLCSSGFSD